jgi:hypothetical protein
VAAFSTATKTATETTWSTPFRQLKGFGHLIINADEVFGTDSQEETFEITCNDQF